MGALPGPSGRFPADGAWNGGRSRYIGNMTITLQVPDFIVNRLGADEATVEAESLHTLVLGLYREGRVSAPEAMLSLGITSRAEFEARVARHHAEPEWPEEEVERELATIRRLNG